LALLLGAAVLVPTTAEAAPTIDSGPGRLMLVLDSSGSMKEPAAGGQTKIAAAKQALGTVVDDLPDDREVGLRVYGAKVFSGKDPGACTDSQRVVDLGTDNRDELRRAISTYRPYGETPIGYALQQAGEDLGDDGQRTIVLVSDGEPTCRPDPCRVARQLSQDGIDLRIDVVGLDVSGKARDRLRCIADAGHGSYYDADDADSLAENLGALSERAFRPFDFTGEPVEGTTDPADAPELATGQYLDKVPRDGEPVHYRVPRTASGSTVHVGVTLEGEGGSPGTSVRARIEAGSGDHVSSCGIGTAYGVAIGISHPLLFGEVISGRSDPDDPCTSADELRLSIENDQAVLAGTPIEIVVYEEPPLEPGTETELPPPPDQPAWTTLKPGRPVRGVVPGTSIASAPVVEDGTYAGTLHPGESQVFAIPLDWGQSLQAQLDAPLDDAIKSAGGVGSGVDVRIIGPARSTSAVSFFGEEPSDWTTTAFGNLWTTDDTTFRTGAQSQTIAYRNRESSDSDVSGASMAGLHYVQVTYNVQDPVDLDYRLTLATSGEAGAGAPDYQDVGLDEPSAEGQAGGTASAESGASTGSATRDPATSPTDDGDDGTPWPVIGIGAAVLVVAAGAAGLWLRRRSARA